jgi:hypothetical protein
MEFDHFGLSVKDLAIKNMITRCNSSELLYTFRLLAMRPPQASTYYALSAAAGSTSLGHHCLNHPIPMLYQSFLLAVLSYVINPEMFLSTMLASSINALDFRFISHHLMPHIILI